MSIVKCSVAWKLLWFGSTMPPPKAVCLKATDFLPDDGIWSYESITRAVASFMGYFMDSFII